MKTMLAVSALLGCLGLSLAADAAEIAYGTQGRIQIIGAKLGPLPRCAFWISVAPRGVTMQNLSVTARFLEGSGNSSKSFGTVSCAVGNLTPQAPGTAYGYGGISCNFPQSGTACTDPTGITLPRSRSVRVAIYSNFTAEKHGATTPTITEGLTRISAKDCSTFGKLRPKGGTKRIEVHAFRLKGAIRSDRTIDKSKICLKVTPRGAPVKGLHVYASLVSVQPGKESIIGSFHCNLASPGLVVDEGRTLGCAITDNNDVPEKFVLPSNSGLRIKYSVTFDSPDTQAAPDWEGQIRLGAAR